MVKAYLKYVQQDVYGGLTGNNSNIVLCTLYDEQGQPVGAYVVSACNEVVNLTNLSTGDVHFKIYDKEAIYGYVTCLRASSDLLAVGYSSGTILVFSLKVEENGSTLEQSHKFCFHRSPVTSIVFFANNTQMASGSADTYIIVYDLIADTAQFKLLGHNE